MHLYKDQPLFSDVDMFLRSLGFQLHRFEGMSRRAFSPFQMAKNSTNCGNQDLWTDAIYTRDWMQLDKIPVAKLRKMAAILHDLFRSIDLVNLILATADRREGTNHSAVYLERLSNSVNHS